MPKAIREMRPYMSGSRESLVFRPVDTASQISSLFLIGTGFGGSPDDYQEMGRQIAMLGGTVVIPDCNQPAPNSTSDDPLQQRADVLSYTAEDALEHYELDELILVGHSLSAAVQARVIGVAPGRVKAYISLMGVGFQRVSPTNHVFGVPKQIKDAVSVIPRFAWNSLRHPTSVQRRLDLSRRASELLCIYRLEEGHNLPYIEQAKTAGALCLAYVGPQDWAIKASETRRVATDVLGANNIRDLHPNSGHFATQTHARHVARLVFEACHTRGLADANDETFGELTPPLDIDRTRSDLSSDFAIRDDERNAA